ncbi:hypothetical protein AMAG_17739 [Allomyces macrogynus ATCC 38327]|uniref:Uncharacterized protein n=1 Tax=Allomyces macrogynus (strain ATCC 38327) TaxID=578462 RepID=A0A0L0RYJ2_ALLM3|nr:hypothetical protein AMAG_17739 [Allomyces macrogynus ATCC 38327]|eukprot:KNE55126.1 hypothetical protein AMAG_17739 [Allomyces macrogynus ATCC 38327]
MATRYSPAGAAKGGKGRGAGAGAHAAFGRAPTVTAPRPIQLPSKRSDQTAAKGATVAKIAVLRPSHAAGTAATTTTAGAGIMSPHVTAEDDHHDDAAPTTTTRDAPSPVLALPAAASAAAATAPSAPVPTATPAPASTGSPWAPVPKPNLSGASPWKLPASGARGGRRRAIRTRRPAARRRPVRA